MQGFLGVCGYYRRFVIKHASIVDPFRDLLKDKSSWSWTQKHDIAFNELKNIFINAAKFYVQCDASNAGISGVLFQLDKNNHKRIVAITSRVLTNVRRRLRNS